jgi:predicted RNA-binding Zn-ribbon protein involved in translation (DUF1610 family)
MNAANGVTDFPRLRNLYHGLPAVAAIVLAPVFVAVFYATGSYLLSTATVASTAALILWKWVAVERQLDQFVCPKCGENITETVRMPWVYPPRKCRNCDHDFIAVGHASIQREG